MMPRPVTPDTKVALLLCSRLGQPDDNSVKPLSTMEYAALAHEVRDGLPGVTNLFKPDVSGQVAKRARLDPKRVQALLNRGGALALAVEDWTNKGIWIISHNDKEYPRRLIERLSDRAPPLLFGTGNPELLAKGGLAVVGSREMSPRAKSATRQIGHLCAQTGIQLISGGARGVDSEGMQTVLEDGGRVVGFLADSLVKTSVNPKYRQGLREGRLALVTASDPKTPFSVGNAMARNKFVYCLSDWTVVIASSYNEGGTWAGAIENLKNKWVPMFVRKDVDVPEGNYRLIDKGGITLVPDSLSAPDRFVDILNNSQITFPKICVCDLDSPYLHVIDMDKETKPVPISSEKKTGKGADKIIPDATIENTVNDLFPIIWPYIEEELMQPKTDKELAAAFKVELNQMRSWLSVAVGKGIVKKMTRPVRYQKSMRENTSLDTWTE